MLEIKKIHQIAPVAVLREPSTDALIFVTLLKRTAKEVVYKASDSDGGGTYRFRFKGDDLRGPTCLYEASEYTSRRIHLERSSRHLYTAVKAMKEAIELYDQIVPSKIPESMLSRESLELERTVHILVNTLRRSSQNLHKIAALVLNDEKSSK